MKITLGGKLSILLAALWAGACATSFLPADPLSRGVEASCGLVVYVLSFPLGWLNGMFWADHEDSQTQVIFDLLVMIPNFFFLGYTIAGLFHLLRWLRLRPPSAVSDEQFRRLLDEHRKHNV